MIHCRVGEFISSHYSPLVHRAGRMVKGGATTQDNLYQVDRYCNKEKAKRKGTAQ